jgi:outer membrane protein assembly factor BamB
MLFNSWAHGITSIDPKTGKTNWEAAGVFKLRTVSSPVVAGGLVFGSCGSGGGGNYVVAVRPGNAQGRAAELAYKVTASAPYVPTSVAKGDLLFLWSDKGIATCIKAATGDKVWQKRVGGDFFGSPVRVGDRLYAISLDGEVVVLAASENYDLLGRNPLGETSRATPAVAGGAMYLRTLSHLFSIGGKKETK